MAARRVARGCVGGLRFAVHRQPEDLARLRYGMERGAVLDMLRIVPERHVNVFGAHAGEAAWRAVVCTAEDTCQACVLVFADDELVAVTTGGVAEALWNEACGAAGARKAPDAASLRTLPREFVLRRLDPERHDFTAVNAKNRSDPESGLASETAELLANPFTFTLAPVFVPLALLELASGSGFDSHWESHCATIDAFDGDTTVEDVVARLGQPGARVSPATNARPPAARR